MDQHTFIDHNGPPMKYHLGTYRCKYRLETIDIMPIDAGNLRYCPFCGRYLGDDRPDTDTRLKRR